MLGVANFIELKAKTDRGEGIKALTFGSIVHQFLDKEKRGNWNFWDLAIRCYLRPDDSNTKRRMRKKSNRRSQWIQY